MRRHLLLLLVLVPLLGAVACGRAADGSCESLDDCPGEGDASKQPGQTTAEGGPEAASDTGASTPDGTVPSDGFAPEAGDDVFEPPADAPADDAHPVDDGAGDARPIDDGGISDAEAGCGSDAKACGAGCVSTSSPTTGCAASGCSPCEVANATATCASGECAIGECSAGFADCDHDAGNGCETNTTTASNCGTCGTTCPVAEPYCVAGDGGYACGTNCASGDSLCGSSCVNLTNDPSHCGGCTNVCNDAGAGATNECASSKCEVVCSTAGTTLCPNGSCYDFTNDPNHCGSCTNVCPALANGTNSCVDAGCEPTCNGGYKYCGGGCAQCSVTNAATYECSGTSCVVATCQTPYSVCGDSCFDLTNDPNHCGSCTKTCPTLANGTDNCVGSACDPVCNSGYLYCDGACAPCSVANAATYECSGASCVVATCASPYSVCGDSCFNLTDDPNHCGSCTNACPTLANGTDNCVGSACDPVCNSGYLYCDGACAQCNVANAATYECSGASCVAATCTSPYSVCSGACFNLTDDPNHCGSCTKTCPPLANGTDNCVSSACDPVCNSGYMYCGGDCALCSVANAATYQCSGTSCVVATCATGYHVCNGACDPNSDLPTQDPCEISETFGVFVSSSQGSSGGLGTRASPYNTIQAGIAAAASSGKRVYVCAESYNEATTLASNVSIFGYFTCTGGTWAVGTGAASITEPAPSSTAPSIAVTASNVTGVRLESLSWTAANAGASQSSYGMLATGSTLTLVNVQLTAGSGGNGSTGTLGTQPPQQSGACSASDGANGQSGPNGSPTAASYSSAGYSPGTGGSGSAGATGDNGTAGGAGACPICGVLCEKDSVDDICLTTSAKTTSCGGPGTSGCGGPGGAGGGGGTGGGASIGLFSANSAITTSGGALVSRNAGNGGPGVAGVPAPSSWTNSAGATGRSASSEAKGCTSASAYPNCVTGDVGTCTAAGGSAGGTGGTGGSGGGGAGGSGGDSYSYYVQGAASVTVSGSAPVYVNGTAGTGGTGGGTASSGAGGTAAQHN